MQLAQTYVQIQQQILALQGRAEELRKKELDEVVARIKEAIAVYRIAPEMLYGRGKAVAEKSSASAKSRQSSKASKVTRSVAFRDSNGNVWGGRGPRPAWLREALEAGKALEDFRI